MSGERRGTNTGSDLSPPVRCLVTGATGFVGRALVARLRSSGAFVRGVARFAQPSEADEFVAADLAQLPQGTTIFEGIDVVFHLAAKTHDMAEAPGVEREYRRTNVDGTRRLVESAQGKVRRVVFVSSVKAIDEGNDVPATEETPARPLTPYGRSKLEAERMVMSAAADGAFEAVCLRFPIVYGPGQRGNLERMIDAIARRTFLPPPRVNLRSMLHVENAVDALLIAGEHRSAAGNVYIVSDASPYSTREIYDTVRRALGRGPAGWQMPMVAFRMLAIAGDTARRVAGRRVGFDSDAFQKLLGSAVYDSTRMQKQLGYRPRHDLASAMPGMIAARGGRP